MSQENVEVVRRMLEETRQFRDRGPWGRSVRFAAERYFDVDEERVLVFTRVASTGKGSGATLDSRVARLFTVRNGSIVAVKVYSDRSEALKAVGLEE